MSSKNNKINIAIEATRLTNFLGQNKLVQAHAVSSKLESLMREELESGSKEDIENHPFWGTYRDVHKTRQFILSGDNEKALKIASDIARTVSKKTSN